MPHYPLFMAASRCDVITIPTDLSQIVKRGCTVLQNVYIYTYIEDRKEHSDFMFRGFPFFTHTHFTIHLATNFGTMNRASPVCSSSEADLKYLDWCKIDIKVRFNRKKNLGAGN